MAIGDIANTILSRYKADTSDHRRELKKLRGEERRRHRELLDEMEAQNRRIDDQIAMWGKVAAGVGAVTVAFAAGVSGFRAYQEQARLTSATAGVNLRALKEATGGLVSEVRLLEFAAGAMNGTFQLSQKEMETVLQGALALRKEFGITLPEALERVGQAVTEGNVEPLEEFGIVLDVTNSTAEASTAIVEEMGRIYRGTGGDISLAGDGIARSNTSVADTIHHLQVELGELVVKLEPAIEAMIEFAGAIGSTVSWFDRLTDRIVGVNGSQTMQQERARLAAENERLRASAGQVVSYGGGYQSLNPSFERDIAANELAIRGLDRRIAREQLGILGANLRATEADTAKAVAREMQGILAENRKQVLEGIRAAAGRGRGTDVAGPVMWTDGLGSVIPAGTRFGTALSASQLPGMEGLGVGLGDGGALGSLGGPGALFADLDRQAAGAASQKARLAQVFGPLEEFDAYKTAFDALGTAAGAAFQAWIDGTQSMGDAIRSVIAQSLAATGQQMLVEALKHTAYGFGALALGPIAGATAAQHFQAAAMFGAGALAAGATAKAMGGSGGGAAVGAAPAMTGIGGSAGAASSGPQTQVIMLGNRFDSMNPAAREEAIRRELRMGGITLTGDFVVDG